MKRLLPDEALALLLGEEVTPRAGQIWEVVVPHTLGEYSTNRGTRKENLHLSVGDRVRIVGRLPRNVSLPDYVFAKSRLLTKIKLFRIKNRYSWNSVFLVQTQGRFIGR